MMDKLTILQQNMNKSSACQHNLLSNNILIREGINVVALQEPAISGTRYTITSRDWTPVYPTSHSNVLSSTRSITFIRADISTDSWNQLDFPSNDVTVMQITGQWGKLTIFNIYNDGGNNDTVRLLMEFHHKNQAALERAETGEVHIIWLR